MKSPDQNTYLSSDLLEPLERSKMEILSAGEALIDLSMINPDLPPERFMVDKLLEYSNQKGVHKYAVSRGIRKLRQGFKDLYQKKFNVDLDINTEICATLGSKDAFLHGLMSFIKQDDLILIGKPTYPAYLSALKLIKTKCDFFDVQTDEDLMLSNIITKLKEKKYKLLVLNFPHNPTGIKVSEGFYQNFIKP